MTDPVMQNTSSPDTPKNNSAVPAARRGSLIGYTLVALGLALFIRFFVAAPYVVSGASMEPSFEDWHYLIVDRVSYDFGQPERGDVVIFDLPQNQSRALIKRVIGLPGETIILSGSAPSVTIINAVYPEGFTLNEPYLDSKNFGGASNMRVTLGPDQYFVLGDNRKVSADSRLWGILPRSDIVGRVFLRLYPLNDIGILPGESRYH
ncbi:signal peptidase I [Candidatus Kaiserbacteria bacterium]|nr:signal peptidase I [Candidatus Kaiserbacteria bacterium]